MFDFFAKRFVKDYKNHSNPKVRLKLISLSSIIAIAINIILVITKLTAGFIIKSNAVINDGFNNLSDTLVSLMALIGSKISQKPADKEHPWGHGRFESLITLFVSMLIIYVGINLLISAVKSIGSELIVKFTPVTLAILILSNLFKIYIYILNRSLYKSLDSDLNYGVMIDARNDILATTGIIIGAIIQNIFRVNVDAYMGIILALFVLKPGIDLFIQTSNYLIGQRVDLEIEEEVGKIIMDNDFIIGYHNLAIHEYGKGHLEGSVDVEIAENLSLLVAHQIITDIQKNIQKEVGVNLSIHMDPTYSIIKDKDIEEKIEKIEKQAKNEYEDF